MLNNTKTPSVNNVWFLWLSHMAASFGITVLCEFPLGLPSLFWARENYHRNFVPSLDDCSDK